MRTILMSGFLAFAFAGPLVAPLAAADIPQVRLSLSSPFDTPPSRGADMLAKELANSRVMQIEVLPEGTISPPSQVADTVLRNIVGMGLAPAGSLVQFNPGFSIFSLPFAFDDLGAVARFQQGPAGKDLLQTLETKALKGLAYWPIEMTQLVTNRPVRGAGDLKGAKIANALGPLAQSVLQSLGASTPAIPGNELVAALDRGAVDAAAVNFSVPTMQKIFAQGKYLNYTNQQYRGTVLIANLQFWNGLSEEARQKTLAAIDRISPTIDRLASQQTAFQIDKLTGGGAQLVVPGASAFKSWRQAAESTWLASGGDKQLFAAAGGTEGGGDPCGPGQCRCPPRTCSADCCSR